MRGKITGGGIQNLVVHRLKALLDEMLRLAQDADQPPEHKPAV